MAEELGLRGARVFRQGFNLLADALLDGFRKLGQLAFRGGKEGDPIWHALKPQSFFDLFPGDGNFPFGFGLGFSRAGVLRVQKVLEFLQKPKVVQGHDRRNLLAPPLYHHAFLASHLNPPLPDLTVLCIWSLLYI
jgi:hypothetical protein